MHGVHHLEYGQPIEVWLDAAHVYVFAENGELVAPASFARAA
jgi:glycerol transport system ATP-binding protein